MNWQIRKLQEAQGCLDRLLVESRAEGFDHIRRLVSHWEDGSNRFNRPGEALYGAFVVQQLVGAGGLNRDPFARDPRIGRVSHVHVLPSWRRRGVATSLLRAFVDDAQVSFAILRLRAAAGDASLLYESIGFERVTEANATHRRLLQG